MSLVTFSPFLFFVTTCIQGLGGQLQYSGRGEVASVKVAMSPTNNSFFSCCLSLNLIFA